MPDVVLTFCGMEEIEQFADPLPELVAVSFSGFSQQRLEFCKSHLDWVQVRRVRRQEQQPGPGIADGGLDISVLVARQIVHDDEIAGLQLGDEKLPYILGEDDAVHRSVYHQRCNDPGGAEPRSEGCRLPVAIRGKALDPLSARPAAMAPDHVGGGACLIYEDQPAPRKAVLDAPPLRPLARNVRAFLLGCEQAFF